MFEDTGIFVEYVDIGTEDMPIPIPVPLDGPKEQLRNNSGLLSGMHSSRTHWRINWAKLRR